MVDMCEKYRGVASPKDIDAGHDDDRRPDGMDLVHADDNPSHNVGQNLRRLRTKRGLSMERLSKLCNVSRAMLSQIELAQSVPTIGVVWRVAKALGVPFSALISPIAGIDSRIFPASRCGKYMFRTC